MDAFFEINENLKEEFIKMFGANWAKTVFHKNGTMYLEDPFYETEVRWPTFEDFKSLTNQQATDMVSALYSAKLKVEEAGGQMTAPFFEMLKYPQLVWAIFLKKA